LQAHIDGKLDRLVAAAQDFVEAALHAGEPFAVDVDIAHHMSQQLTFRVDAAAFRLKLQAGNAQTIDGEFLTWRQLPLDPHKALVGGELGGDLALFEIGQDARKLLGHPLRILDKLG